MYPLLSVEEIVDALNTYVDMPGGEIVKRSCTEEEVPDLCEALPEAFKECITPEIFREKLAASYGTMVGNSDEALISNTDFEAAFIKSVRETSFRRKLEAAYPTKIGVNGILSARDFNQALLKVLDDDTLCKLMERFHEKLVECSNDTPPPRSHHLSFYGSCLMHNKYLSYSGGPPAVTSDEIPAVLPGDFLFHTVTFANSKSNAACTFYVFKNLNPLADPDLTQAVYQWKVPAQRNIHAVLPKPLPFKAGETISVYCVDPQRTAMNVCFELHLQTP